jgi:hypothetical protein
LVRCRAFFRSFPPSLLRRPLFLLSKSSFDCPSEKLLRVLSVGEFSWSVSCCCSRVDKKLGDRVGSEIKRMCGTDLLEPPINLFFFFCVCACVAFCVLCVRFPFGEGHLCKDERESISVVEIGRQGAKDSERSKYFFCVGSAVGHTYQSFSLFKAHSLSERRGRNAMNGPLQQRGAANLRARFTLRAP